MREYAIIGRQAARTTQHLRIWGATSTLTVARVPPRRSAEEGVAFRLQDAADQLASKEGRAADDFLCGQVDLLPALALQRADGSAEHDPRGQPRGWRTCTSGRAPPCCTASAKASRSPDVSGHSG